MRTLFLPLLLIAFAVASCLSPDPVETAIAEHDASIDECGGAKAALVLYINKIAQRIAAEEAYDPDADYDTLAEFRAGLPFRWFLMPIVSRRLLFRYSGIP